MSYQLAGKSAAVVAAGPIKFTVSPTATTLVGTTILAQDCAPGYGLYRADRLVPAAAAVGTDGDAGKIVTTANANAIFTGAQNGDFCFAVLQYNHAA